MQEVALRAPQGAITRETIRLTDIYAYRSLPFVNAYNELSPESRLWIFALEEPIDPETTAKLEIGLAAYTQRWKAHGLSVLGGWTFVADRFLAVAADPAAAQVSGCSIDDMTRSVKELLLSNGGKIADFEKVFFRKDGEIVCESRSDFKKLAAAGKLSPETPVFDTTVVKLEQLQQGKFELPLSASWHKRLVGWQ